MVILLPSGALQRKALLLLLEEGQMSFEQMSQKLEVHRASLYNTAQELIASDMLTEEMLPSAWARPPGRKVTHLGLTKRGIEAALTLEAMREQELHEEWLLKQAADELF